LDVAIYRVRKKKDLKILTLDEDGNATNKKKKMFTLKLLTIFKNNRII